MHINKPINRTNKHNYYNKIYAFFSLIYKTERKKHKF